MHQMNSLKGWWVGSIASLLVSSALVGTTCAAESSATDSTRIAFVNTQILVDQAPQAARASTILQAEFAPRDSDLKQKLTEIKTMEERLARDGAIMNATENRKLEREILNLQRDFKRDQETFAEDLKLRRNEELARLQREVASVVVEVAKANGFDMVLEAGVVYANQKVDITPQVLESLKRPQTNTTAQ